MAPGKPLPPTLETVLQFLNTIDVELGTDDLAAGPEALASWLAEAGLAPEPVVATQAQHRLALELRSGLRALALANNGGPIDEAATDAARRALRQLPLQAQPVVNNETPLVPQDQSPVLAALSRLAADYVLATAAGQWNRLRRCPASDCAWVFWDSSAKGARRWCNMRVCGNRAKARAFVERQRRATNT